MRRLVIAVATLVLVVSPLAAQDTVARAATGLKNPTAARVIGILPGAGHVYAGEPGRGLMYLGGTAGLLLIGATAMVAECYGDLLGGPESCEASNTADFFAAATIGLWAWSIYDAGRAAHRTNAKRRVALSLGVAPGFETAGGGRRTGGVKLVLSMRGW